MGAKAAINAGMALANQQENNAIYRLELEVVSSSTLNNSRLRFKQCGATMNKLTNAKKPLRNF